MMYAATLAGIAFGNSGCTCRTACPTRWRAWCATSAPPGYPQDEPMVPHGMSVIVNAPSVFRFTACACPERHLHGADCLGADIRGATPDDAGEIVAGRIIEMMQATAFPGGLAAVGYGERDVPALAEGAYPQRRVMTNSPRDASRDDLAELFRGAMKYW